jgi:predicted aldo/keto reductase-like oxidoreductase
MSNLDRRSFLKGTAGALAAATLASNASGAPAALPKATDVRTLGNTGLKCSYLGIGTGVRGRGKGITDQTMKLSGEEYVGLLEYAYQQGITYFDLADQYGSHHYMREAMKRSIPRDKVMILSKIWSREPDVAKSDLDRMRKELATDCIDVVLMHCLRGGEENWPEKLKATMDMLSEAKAKGWIRAHGVSCHNLKAFERVPDEEWVDVVLARINPFSVRMDGPTEVIVPILQKIHDAGKGVLGMKILGEGDPKVVNKMNESLKFVAELGSMDAMTIGFLNKGELDDVKNRIASVATA